MASIMYVVAGTEERPNPTLTPQSFPSGDGEMPHGAASMQD